MSEDDVIYQDEVTIPVPDTDGQIRHETKSAYMEMYAKAWEELEECIIQGILNEGDEVKLIVTLAANN